MKGFAQDGLPHDFGCTLWRTLGAIKIHTKSGRNGRVNAERSEWNPQRGVPSVLTLVDSRQMLESGVPLPAVFVMRLVQINIQIDPFVLGGDFELFIALNVLKIRADEYFGHIPVPQCIGFVGGIRLGLEIQLPERTNEEKIDVVFCPAGTNLGAVFRNRSPVGVRLRKDRTCLPPEGRIGVGIQSNIAVCVYAL